MAGELLLVVDDNETNVRLLKLYLEKRGYVVATARGGVEARAQLEALRPRLVLMDIQLPDIDGLQLTREIKADARLGHTLIVAVTSYAMKGDRQRALGAGCDGYVSKPIDFALLRAELDRQLAPGRAALSGPSGGSP